MSNDSHIRDKYQRSLRKLSVFERLYKDVQLVVFLCPKQKTYRNIKQARNTYFFVWGGGGVLWPASIQFVSHRSVV